MTLIEERDEKRLFWVLNKILNRDGTDFYIGRTIIMDDGTRLSNDEFEKLVREAQNCGAIRILNKPYYHPEMGMTFLINDEPKFDEIFKSLEEKLNRTTVVESAQKEENGRKNSILRMDFDSQNGVIRCGDIKPYSFHKGARGDKPLLKLFRKLWYERQCFLNGRERKKGESFPVNALAEQVEVTKEELINKLKGIGRMLKTRKFPAKIERKNGILLVVTEK